MKKERELFSHYIGKYIHIHNIQTIYCRGMFKICQRRLAMNTNICNNLCYRYCIGEKTVCLGMRWS